MRENFRHSFRHIYNADGIVTIKPLFSDHRFKAFGNRCSRLAAAHNHDPANAIEIHRGLERFFVVVDFARYQINREPTLHERLRPHRRDRSSPDRLGITSQFLVQVL